MNKSNKLLETCDQLGDAPEMDLMEDFRYYGSEVQNSLSILHAKLEDAKLPGSHPYSQMLKQLSDKSDDILKKVSDFVDKSQARKKELQAKDKKSKEDVTVVEAKK